MNKGQVRKVFANVRCEGGLSIGERKKVVLGIGLVVIDIHDAKEGVVRQSQGIANARGTDGSAAAKEPGLLFQKARQASFDGSVPLGGKNIRPVGTNANLRNGREIDRSLQRLRHEEKPE